MKKCISKDIQKVSKNYDAKFQQGETLQEYKLIITCCIEKSVQKSGPYTLK
jgi:hypothetical protein